MAPSRMLPGAIVAALLVAPTVLAQPLQSRTFSNPVPPAPEALRRLNLTQAWRAYVPMESRRDGLLRIELDGKDMIVLTRSGMVMRLDAETGTVRWRARVGKPYTLLPFVALNTRAVYVIVNATLISLHRSDGNKAWEYRLRAGVSAAPVADDEQLYVPYATGRVAAFYLPFVTGEAGTDSPVYSEAVLRSEIAPKPVWEEETNLTLAFRPLQTSETLFMVGLSGRAIGFSKVVREGVTSTEIFRFNAEAKITAPPGQYGDTAYLGDNDGGLQAVNLATGRLRWRHTAGTTVTRRPVALETDVFFTTRRDGMARIDRATGESQWKVPVGRRVATTNTEADRFLAANGKYVYAHDRSGRLLVLDRKRGTRLSMLDTTAFRFAVVNELTDRLYLAAHNGLIVCLRDREQTAPIRHRAKLEELSSPTRKLLDKPITEKAGKPSSLRDVLAALRIKYKLRFVVAEQAFKQAGMANFQERQVSTPAVEDRPLKDYLQRTLSQVKATYLLRDDTILIIPGKPEDK